MKHIKSVIWGLVLGITIIYHTESGKGIVYENISPLPGALYLVEKERVYVFDLHRREMTLQRFQELFNWINEGELPTPRSLIIPSKDIITGDPI